MDYVKIFYYNLMQVLLATCPYDTGNMKSHIKMHEHPEYMAIEISAPKNDTDGNLQYDYALAVNEGLSAKAHERQMSPKEARNYHWVQRACKQSAYLTSEKVIFEGGFTI